MNISDRRDEYKALAKNPVKFLAYRSIRAALKRTRSFKSSGEGFKILVVPPGYRPLAYKTAMHLISGVVNEEWDALLGEIRIANPPKKKASLDEPISVFGLEGLRALIAGSINEVPSDVQFAAEDILFLDPPSAKDIALSRRALGRSPLTDEVAQFLVGKPQNVIVASIYRRSVELNDVEALINSTNPASTTPDLFELPGFDELKCWASEVRTDVENWRLGKLSWRETFRGALVSGAPGTGKTLFANALARSLGFKMVTATVGGWQAAGYLNDTLSEMRKSFEEANVGGGVILFLDEFDSIGRRPTSPSGRENDQYWQVVINEFLNQINGIKEGVLIIAATNHPNWIDPAILRAGRIERHFALSLPDKITRSEILKYHLGDVIEVTTLLEVAGDLEGRTAASLEEIARSALRFARNEDRIVELHDLKKAIPERLGYTLEEQFQFAVHEAGHALMALSLGYAKSAAIEVRETFDPMAGGHVGGLTSYELNENHIATEIGLLNRIAVCLSGMAAEAVVFENRSIGAGGMKGSDVEQATAIARRMVASYGLGKVPVFIADADVVTDTLLPSRLQDEVAEVLQIQYERVVAILAKEKARLINLAKDVVANRNVKIERASGA